MFIIQKIVVGGGGAVFINSDNQDFMMNVGHGYDFAGWDFSNNESMIVAASLRLGGFGIQVDIIKTFEVAPGLAQGLTAYYNAPVTART